MNRVLRLALLAVAALALPSGHALAQASFPTAASGVRAQAVVPLQCDASAANCAPASGINPAAVGGQYNATLPTLTDGQRREMQLDLRGGLYVTLKGSGVATAIGAAAISDASAAIIGLATWDQGAVYNGATWDRQRGDANGLVVQPGLTSTFWSYTSGVTPILSNTVTGVTIKAAAGASVRNYIDSCQLTTTAFGASVPLALRDGTGGTVRWALTVPTAGFLQPVTVTFSPPLQGTANTLWEVATPTANTTGTVTLNCAGHTGI